MKIPSLLWHHELLSYKNEPIPSPQNTKILPWLTPVVDPVIRDLIERWGTVRKLAEGELIFPEGSSVDQLVLVASGITARRVGTETSRLSTSSNAFATPGRFACGNLNFFSRRPCAGTYFAITPAEVICCSQKLLRALCAQDQSMMMRFLQQFELCTLSDRLGFMADKILSVEERIACLYYVWSENYGKRETDEEGRTMIRMPVPLTNETQRSIICCAKSAYERAQSEIRRNRLIIHSGDTVLVAPEFLQPIENWLSSVKGS